MSDLLEQYYLPELNAIGCADIAIRVYSHIVRAGSETMRVEDNPDGKTRLVFSPLETALETFKNLVITYPSTDYGVALASLVAIGSELKHIFLADCEISSHEVSAEELLSSLRGQVLTLPLIQGAYVFRTKNSYHIVSFRMLSQHEWENAMLVSLCIQCKGKYLIDRVSVARSLLRGYSALRISAFKDKEVPVFIDRV